MLEFTCPTCGKRVQGDNTLAGKHVQCAFCNSTMVAPTTGIQESVQHARGAVDTAFRDGEPPLPVPTTTIAKVTPHILRRFLPLIALIVVGLTAILLAIPRVQVWRAAAARTQSTNNLKNIGEGMHSFHDVHRRLPFNGMKEAIAGDPGSGSWAFQILPFIDHKELFDQPNVNVGVSTYMCPERGRPAVSTTGPWTDYFINPWLNDREHGSPSIADNKVHLFTVTGGTSHCIFFGHGCIDPEIYRAKDVFAQSTDIFKGGDPALARTSKLNHPDRVNDATLNWGGPFPQGALMLMGDGVVRMFSYDGWSDEWPGILPLGNRRLGRYLNPGGELMHVLDDRFDVGIWELAPRPLPPEIK